MTAPLCACEQPSPDAVICWDCTTRLTQALEAVPDLTDDLDIALANQAVLSDRGPTRSGVTPLPYNEHASHATTHLCTVLWLWATALEMPLPAPGSHADAFVVLPPATSTAQWLLGHMSAVRQHPEAGTIVDEVTTARERAKRAIDKLPQRVYAGPCPACRADLLTWPGHTTITCAGCGTTHDIATRQEHMRTQLDDYLGTATYAAAILPGIGVHVTAATIRGWAFRHRLEVRVIVPAHPPSPEQHLYRLGDIVDLALERDAAKSRLTLLRRASGASPVNLGASS